MAIPTTAASAWTSTQVGAITTSEISTLTTAQLDALTSAQTQYLTAEQVAAILPTANNTVLTTAGIAKIKAAALNALTGDAFAGLTSNNAPSLGSAQIAGLSSAHIEELATNNDLQYITTAALAGLASNNIAGLSVAGLSTAQFASLGTAQLGLLSSDQIGAITTAEVVALTTAQAAGFPTVKAQFLTADQVAAFETADLVKLPAAAVNALSSDAFKGLTSDGVKTLTVDQIKALSSEHVAELGTNSVSTSAVQLEYVSNAAMAGFSTNIHGLKVESLSTEQFSKLVSTQIALLTSAQVQALTADELAVGVTAKSLPASIAPLITAKQITDVVSVSASSIAGLAPEFVQKLSADALAAAASNLVSANVIKLTADQVTPILKDLPAAAMGGLTSILSGLKPSDLSVDQFSGIKGADLKLFSTQVPEITTEQIAALTADQIKNLPVEIAKALSFEQVGALPSKDLAGLSTANLTALTDDALKGFGANAAGLASAQIAALKTDKLGLLSMDAFGAFSKDAVVGFTKDNIAGLRISELSLDAFAALKPDQIKLLTPDQIGQITPDEMSKLTVDQAKVLTGAQAVKITPDQAQTLSHTSVAAFLVKDAAGANVLNSLTKEAFGNLSPDVLAHLTKEQGAALNADQIKILGDNGTLTNLSIDVIKAIAPGSASAKAIQVDQLNADQFAVLTPDQVKNFTGEQFAQLTPEYTDVLLGKGYSLAHSLASAPEVLKQYVFVDSAVSVENAVSTENGGVEIVAGNKAVAIKGTAGNDKLIGSDKSDNLVAGNGADVLQGNDGKDVFEFAVSQQTSTPDTTTHHHTIADFVKGDDRIAATGEVRSTGTAVAYTGTATRVEGAAAVTGTTPKAAVTETLTLSSTAAKSFVVDPNATLKIGSDAYKFIGATYTATSFEQIVADAAGASPKTGWAKTSTAASVYTAALDSTVSTKVVLTANTANTNITDATKATDIAFTGINKAIAPVKLVKGMQATGVTADATHANITAGLAKFDSATTDKVAAVAASLKTAEPGASVVWQEGDDAFLYITDGADGVQATDALIKLANTPVEGVVAAGGNIIGFYDDVAPTATVTQSTYVVSNAGTTSASIEVTSNELGTAYLVPEKTVVKGLDLDAAAFPSVAIEDLTAPTVLEFKGLTDGQYRVYTKDLAGNVSDRSADFVVVDNTAPTAAALVDAKGTNLAGDAIINEVGKVSFKVSNPDVVKAFLVSDTVADADLNKAFLEDTANVDSVVVSPNLDGKAKVVTLSANTSLSQGDYHVYLMDKAGNVSLQSDKTVKLDTTKPTVEATDVVLNTTGKVTGVTSSEPGKVYLSSVDMSASGFNFADPANKGKVSAPVTLSTDGTTFKADISVTGLTKGIYNAYSVDAAGNISDKSEAQVVIKDANDKSPVVTYSKPIKDAATITVAASDAETKAIYVVSSKVKVDAKTTPTALDALVSSKDAIKVAVDSTDPFDLALKSDALKDGAYRVYSVNDADLVSKAANTSAVIDVVFDNVAPKAPVVKSKVFTLNTNGSTSPAVDFASDEVKVTAYLVNKSVYPDTTAPTLEDLQNTDNDAAVNSVTLLGTNKAGTIVTTGLSAGTYQVFLADEAGNLSGNASQTITIDNEAPASELAADAPARIKTGDLVKVASTEDGTAYLVNDTVTAFNPASVNSKTTASAVVVKDTDKAIDTKGLDAGTYHVYSVDKAGNLSVKSDSSIVIDNTAPAKPNVATASLRDGSLTQVSSVDTHAQAVYLVGSKDIKTTGMTKTYLDGLVTANKAASILTTDSAAAVDLALQKAKLADGAYKAVVLNDVGLASAGSDNTVTFDTTAPDVTKATFADTKLVNFNNASVTKFVVNAAEDGLKAYLVDSSLTPSTTIDSIEAQIKSEQISDSSAAVAGSPKKLEIPTAGLNDGEYRVYLADAAGNVSAAMGTSAKVRVDTTKPEVTQWDANNPARIKSGVTDIKVTAADTSGSGVASVYLVKDVSGSTFTAPTTATFDKTAIAVATPDASGNATIKTAGLGNGTYHAYAVDKAGNLSVISEGSVVIDNAAAQQPTVDAGTPTAVRDGYILNVANLDVNTSDIYLVDKSVSVKKYEDLTAIANASKVLKVTGADAGAISTTLHKAGLADSTYNVFAVNDVKSVSTAATSQVVFDATAPAKATLDAKAPVLFNNTVAATKVSTVSVTTDGSAEKAYLVNSGDVINSIDDLIDSATVNIGTVASAGAKKIDVSTAGLDAGTYKVYLTDKAGNLSVAADTTLTIDNEAPTAALKAGEPARIKAGTAVNVTSTENGKVFLVKDESGVTFDPKTIDKTKVAVADFKSGDSTHTVDTKGLIDGTYHVYSLDAAGNLSVKSDEAIVIDSAAAQKPAFASGTPTAVRDGYALQMNSFDANTTEAFLVDKSITTVKAYSDLTAAVSSSKAVKITVDGAAIESVLDKTKLADGTYKLYAANDVKSISAPADATVVFDSTAPTAAVLDAKTPAVFNTTAVTNIKVTAAEVGLKGYLVGASETINSIDDLIKGSTISVTATAATSKTFTIPTAGLDEGDYKVYLSDAAGNISTAATLSGTALKIDNTAPDAAAVPTGAIYPANKAFDLTGLEKDASVYLVQKGVAVPVSVADAAKASKMPVIVDASGKAAMNTGTLPAGEYNVYLKDAANNWSAAGDNTIVIDPVAPSLTTVSVTVPSSGFVSGAADVKFTFSEAIANLTAADLVKPVSGGSFTDPVSSTDGKEWTSSFTPAVNTQVASNAISVTTTNVKDLAGNVLKGVVKSTPFAIDNVGPDVKIAIADKALNLTKATTGTLVTFNFSEPVDGFTLADVTIPAGAGTWAVDGSSNPILTPVSSEATNKSYTATFIPAASLETATNVLSIDKSGVKDKAGNDGAGTAKAANLPIDTVAPTVNVKLGTITGGSWIELTNSDGTAGTYDVAIDGTNKGGIVAKFVFSEAIPVANFSTSNIVAKNGTIDATTLAATNENATTHLATTFTAKYVPTSIDAAATGNTVSVSIDKVKDAAGNPGKIPTSSTPGVDDAISPTFELKTAAAKGLGATYTSGDSGAGTNYDATDIIKLTFDSALKTTSGITSVTIDDRDANDTTSHIFGNGVTATADSNLSGDGKTIAITLGANVSLTTGDIITVVGVDADGNAVNAQFLMS